MTTYGLLTSLSAMQGTLGTNCLFHLGLGRMAWRLVAEIMSRLTHLRLCWCYQLELPLNMVAEVREGREGEGGGERKQVYIIQRWQSHSILSTVQFGAVTAPPPAFLSRFEEREEPCFLVKGEPKSRYKESKQDKKLEKPQKHLRAPHWSDFSWPDNSDVLFLLYFLLRPAKKESVLNMLCTSYN